MGKNAWEEEDVKITDTDKPLSESSTKNPFTSISVQISETEGE